MREVDTGTAEIVADADVPGAWLLLVNGVPSSYVNMTDPGELSFEYLQTMATLVDSARPLPDRVDAVHIGGAGCTLPRWIASSRPRSRQVVFEIDGALIELARTEFALAAVPGLKLRVGDGAEGLAGLAAASADLIVRDAFAGDVTPAPLTDLDFVGDAARVLRPDGLYLANIADRPPLSLARREVATAAAAFAHVALVSEAGVFRGRRYANLVLAASAEPLPIETWGREIRGGAVPMRLLADRTLAMFTAGAKPIVSTAGAKPIVSTAGTEPLPTAGTIPVTPTVGATRIGSPPAPSP